MHYNPFNNEFAIHKIKPFISKVFLIKYGSINDKTIEILNAREEINTYITMLSIKFALKITLAHRINHRRIPLSEKLYHISFFD